MKDRYIYVGVIVGVSGLIVSLAALIIHQTNNFEIACRAKGGEPVIFAER